MPGKTSWAEAQHFIAPFALSIWPDNDFALLYATKYIVPESVNEYGIKTVVFELDENRQVELIRTGKQYLLHDFLDRYGQPDQIYIWAISAYTIDPEARFTIALFYEKNGIMVAYEGKADKAPVLKICPTKFIEENTYFWFWEPASGKTFEQIGDPSLFHYDLIFNPIEDIANINTSMFFETYRLIENQNQCFEMADPDLR